MVESPATPGALARRFRAAVITVLRCPRMDGELLTRFVASRDEAAFAELVRRLGPTVLGVCRRFLGNSHDADDAFQVTFLVLARKADTVRPPGKVAAWVHGVATLAARKARAARARRQARETVVTELPERAAPEVVMHPDLGPVLDEELARLPDKFRLPVVLCELRDRTIAQAAAELGWPVGTVASRLSRGRVLLADRLTRRGITAAVTAAVVSSQASTAAVPERLIESTVSAAVAGGVSPSAAVLSLTREVVRAMSVSKVRVFGVGLIAPVAVSMAVALVGGGVVTPNTLAAPVPTTAAKELDAVDRVKLPDLGPLLRVEAVQKDLGLSEADAKKLTDAWQDGMKAQQAKMQAAINQQMMVRPAGGGGAFAISVPGDTEKMNQERIDEFNKKLAAELKPEQVRRLKQLVLQQDGPHALLDRRVIRGLGLSAEQEDRIDALLPPRRKAYIPKVEYAKVAEEIDAAAKEAEKVLTAEQRKRWDTIIGKRLPTEELVRGGPQSEDALSLNTITITGRATLALPAAPPVQPPPPKKDDKE